MLPKEKGRVAVAMSGGVDSSTAAALLKNEGYEVIGLTMHLWERKQDDQGDFGRCCSPEDVRDARRVADQIGIPHYVINLRQAFEEEVVDYFVDEYSRGRTPNPCIRCNERIKFRLLLKKAEELGAKALATGHYARIELAPLTKRYLLKRGKDRNKDQSYFLFSMTQEQMARVLFPLGEKTKEEVRQQAGELGLRVAKKAESQEVCFIPDDNYRGFVEDRKGKELSRPGEIVNRQGKILGFHRGLYSYTIGQRRGLGIAGPHPYYVLALDTGKNRVVAGKKEELLANGLIAARVNWISFARPEGKMEASVQIRYRHPGAPALIVPLGEGKVKVDFIIPQKSVTPGQAVVFYRGDEVLGGGWIEEAF
ncbi:MAG: tRNA 2-thiouridine(34) synthase MnmA [Thermodesulfobacteriota bacterium]|nr:tRNA 2-thiouridine(34) synthase MnmA [Thermodesulfobacteriota bacterium]